MKRSEPFVPWHLQSSIIALKKTVMQLVMKISGIYPVFVFQQNLFKPVVLNARTDGLCLNMPQEKDLMRWDHEMQQQR